MRTEIVDAESLSVGERILAPNGKTWAVVGEPQEHEGGELVELHLAEEGAEEVAVKVRRVTRTTKYEVICK